MAGLRVYRDSICKRDFDTDRMEELRDTYPEGCTCVNDEGILIIKDQNKRVIGLYADWNRAYKKGD